MDRIPEPLRLRRVALLVTAATIIFIFAFQLLSPPTKPVSKPSPILEDLTSTNRCDVYKPAKRVAIIGPSVRLLIRFTLGF